MGDAGGSLFRYGRIVKATVASMLFSMKRGR